MLYFLKVLITPQCLPLPNFTHRHLFLGLLRYVLLVTNTHSTLVALYGFHTVILSTGTCYSTSPGHNNISVKQLLCDQNCFATIKVKSLKNIKSEGRRKINFECYNSNCVLIGSYWGCHMSSWTSCTKKVF